jgi:hypothetical protein
MRVRFWPSFTRLLVAALFASANAWSAEADQAEALPGPGRLVPDVGPTTPGLIEVLGDGTRRFIVNGLRVLDSPDGSLERARQILPAVTVHAPVALPARMGNGFLFAAVVGDTTQLWRSPSWLGDLAPLADVPGKVGDIVPGFDRIYLFVQGGIRAIDPASGLLESVGPLPPGTAVGALAFADAWRAVAVTDYRGALATFDAGNSWRSIPLDGGVALLGVTGGSFRFETPARHWAMGPSGELVVDDTPSPRNASSEPAGSTLPRFERRPLRAAIESGWPLRGPRGEPTAVVAQAGALYRVALDRLDAEHPLGSIVDVRRDVFRREDDDCVGVALGKGFGFVCNAPGASSIYAFEKPFAVREVARFEAANLDPDRHGYRKITASGNGGLVIEGSCARNAWGLGAVPPVDCFLFPSGTEREVAIPAMSAADRVAARPVALFDGRAVFLVGPRAASSGKLVFVDGTSVTEVRLSLDERGAWLNNAMIRDGVEEREPGVLGAWGQVGNELRGVRITLDGKVTLSNSAASSQRTVVSGRFAFDWGTTARGNETTDGGMTWSVVDLPLSPLEGSAHATAACGPVGASEGATRDGKPGSWLRVGWGSNPEAPDALPAPTPPFPSFKLHAVRGVSMRCEVTGEMGGPLPKPKPHAKTPAPPKRPAVAKGLPSAASAPLPLQVFPPPKLPPIFNPANMGKTPPVAPQATTGQWTPFRGSPPPPLRRDDKGFEIGIDASPARIYVWGTKGADWLHNGHVQVRFDDNFDLAGTRASATTPSFWPDEDKAAEALGLTSQQATSWSAFPDVSGQSVVVVGQRPGHVDLFGAAAGELVSAWRDAYGAPLAVPIGAGSVVRIDGTWFFLGSATGLSSSFTTLYRVDGGVVRRLARMPRLNAQSEPAPRLTRRARGRGLGLLIRGVPSFDQPMRDWFVLPINEETGELDAPIRLYPSDLTPGVPGRCLPDEDGWLVNPEFGLPPHLQAIEPHSADFKGVEARLRLDAGRACIEAVAAREEGLIEPMSGTRRSAAVFDPAAAIPLAATDAASGRRWLLRCGQ